MRVVLDTNVLVSGLLSPTSTCGSIVRMMGAREFSLCCDARILTEYRAVLSRPRFRFDGDMLSWVLDFIEREAIVCCARPLAHALRDAADAAFLEVALAASADYLVTGNARHFPVRKAAAPRIVTPREFLDALAAG